MADLSVGVTELGPSSQSPAVPARPHTLMAQEALSKATRCSN